MLLLLCRSTFPTLLMDPPSHLLIISDSSLAQCLNFLLQTVSVILFTGIALVLFGLSIFILIYLVSTGIKPVQAIEYSLNGVTVHDFLDRSFLLVHRLFSWRVTWLIFRS